VLEARLSRLEVMARSGRAADAEALAGRLLSGGGLGSRRAEVARVRGEQLIKLGRCAEARAALESAGTTDLEAAMERCQAGAP
jgi:hypothetical protein